MDAECPSCGGELIPIVYGYPSEEMIDRSYAGEIALGGCLIWPDAPERMCRWCGAEAGRLSNPS